MNRLRAFALLGLLLAGAGQAEQRPLEEMGGACRDYRMNLGPEFSAWRQPALPRLAAADEAAAQAEPLSLRQRYLVALRPASETTLVLPGELPDLAHSGFAGLLSVQVPANGFYRISLGAEVGLEVASDGKAVPPREFEMQARCETILKSLEYTLRAGRTYTLQVTAAGLPEVELLVTARR